MRSEAELQHHGEETKRQLSGERQVLCPRRKGVLLLKVEAPQLANYCTSLAVSRC